MPPLRHLALWLSFLAACGSDELMGSVQGGAPPSVGASVDAGGAVAEAPVDSTADPVEEGEEVPPIAAPVVDAGSAMDPDAGAEQPTPVADATVEEAPTCPEGAGPVDVGADSLGDPATCLTWQKTSPGSYTNRAAKTYCEGLSQDGFDDWRAPRPEELAVHPALPPNSNAYVTNPTYVRADAADVLQACSVDAHSCNLAQYSQGNLSCAWQGVGFAGPLLCVRGEALAGSLEDAFAGAGCGPCAGNVGGAFVEADCR